MLTCYKALFFFGGKREERLPVCKFKHYCVNLRRRAGLLEVKFVLRLIQFSTFADSEFT